MQMLEQGPTHAYATVPTRAYAINAPKGPAPPKACPEPRKRPVPMVPAIYARTQGVSDNLITTWATMAYSDPSQLRVFSADI